VEEALEQHSRDPCTECSEPLLQRESPIRLQPRPREAVENALRRRQGSNRREFTKYGRGEAGASVPHRRPERYGITGQGRGGAAQGLQTCLG